MKILGDGLIFLGMIRKFEIRVVNFEEYPKRIFQGIHFKLQIADFGLRIGNRIAGAGADGYLSYFV